jgi:hypothetical protein
VVAGEVTGAEGLAVGAALRRCFTALTLWRADSDGLLLVPTVRALDDLTAWLDLGDGQALSLPHLERIEVPGQQGSQELRCVVPGRAPGRGRSWRAERPPSPAVRRGLDQGSMRGASGAEAPRMTMVMPLRDGHAVEEQLDRTGDEPARGQGVDAVEGVELEAVGRLVMEDRDRRREAALLHFA